VVVIGGVVDVIFADGGIIEVSGDIVFVVPFDVIAVVVVEIVIVGSAVVKEAWNFVVVVHFLVCYDLFAGFW